MKRHRSPVNALSRAASCRSRSQSGKLGPSFSGTLREVLQFNAALPARPYGITKLGKPGSGAGQSTANKAGADDDPRIRQMRLEAVLLLSKSPLSLRKLSQLAHLADATEARTLVRQLNRTYETFGRAMRVEQVAGGYRLLTRPNLAPWLARLGHLPPPVRLSTPMMETLAVVAYRQPVSRASAEAVRGVACGELLRQLMERELIRIVGRSEELGRPYLYGTTNRFLQLFGLSNTAALPPIQWHALQDDPVQEDSPPDDLSTSTKEPVVSASVASLLSEADPEVTGVATALGPESDGQTDVQDSPSAIDDDDDYDDDDDLDDDDDDDDWDEEDDSDWEDDEEDDLDDDDDDDLGDEDGWEEVGDDEDDDDDDEADDDDDEEDDEEDDLDDDWDEEEDWDDDDEEEGEDDEDDDEDWD